MVLEVAAAAVVVVGWRACGGVYLSFKGELGKPIQIAHRGGFSPFSRRGSGSRILSLGLQDEALRERKVLLLHRLHL